MYSTLVKLTLFVKLTLSTVVECPSHIALKSGSSIEEAMVTAVDEVSDQLETFSLHDNNVPIRNVLASRRSFYPRTYSAVELLWSCRK